MFGEIEVFDVFDAIVAHHRKNKQAKYFGAAGGALVKHDFPILGNAVRVYHEGLEFSEGDLPSFLRRSSGAAGRVSFADDFIRDSGPPFLPISDAGDEYQLLR